MYDNASTIKVPTLWLVSGGDQIADPTRTRQVADRVAGPTTYHDLEGFKHEGFNEVDRGRVFEVLARWLGDRLG